MLIYITSSGYNNPGTFKILYVMATASADGSQVTLTDTAGVPFYQAESSVTNERSLPPINCGGVQVVGIKTATWSNIESVIIGAEKVNTN